MMEFHAIWWQLGDLSLALAWTLNYATAVGAVAALGIGALWWTKRPSAPTASAGWVLSAIGLAGASTAFSVVGFWIAHTVATLFLFRRPDEDQNRRLYTFAQASALADLIFFLGYLFYFHTYRDNFLPTAEQFETASLQLTTFPSKAFAAGALVAGGTRLILGSGFLWLSRSSRITTSDLTARWLTALLIPVGLLTRKLEFLGGVVPFGPLILVVSLSSFSLGAVLLVSFGVGIAEWLNPALWFRAGFEKPIRVLITFVDRRLEVRTVDTLLLLPSRLARAAGVWISLLQSGSLSSYLTVAAVGMAALAAWALRGGHG